MADEKDESVQETEKDQEKSSSSESKEGKTFDAEYVKALREEAAGYRTKLNDIKGYKDKYDKLKSVLSGEDDEDPQERLTALQSEIKTLKVKNSVTQAAYALDADVDLTYAYLKSKGIDDAEDIESEVKKALKEKPSLKNGKAVSTGDSEKGDGEEKSNLNTWIHNIAKRN